MLKQTGAPLTSSSDHAGGLSVHGTGCRAGGCAALWLQIKMAVLVSGPQPTWVNGVKQCDSWPDGEFE